MPRPILAAAFLLLAGPALAAPDAVRQKELLYLLVQDCGSCHGMTLKGGLGAPLLPEVLAQRSDDELLASILDGMPGTAMPPWRPLLTPDEALFLVRALRNGGLAP